MKPSRRGLFGLLLTGLTAGLMAASGPAAAAELRVLAANAVKPWLVELVLAFEQASGHRVSLAWGGTEAVARRVAAGEAVDLVLIGEGGLQRLLQDGQLQAGSRRDIAHSRVAVAARPGLPRPDVSSAAALQRALLGSGRVLISTGPSGDHMAALFERWGLTAALQGRVQRPPSGTQIGELLAQGEADLGFQQVSELMSVPGIQYLGPLPAEAQQITVYAAGIGARSTQAEAVRALLQALTAPASAPVLQRAGMDPA